MSKECGKPLDWSDVEYLRQLSACERRMCRSQWFLDFAAKVSATLKLLEDAQARAKQVEQHPMEAER